MDTCIWVNDHSLYWVIISCILAENTLPICYLDYFSPQNYRRLNEINLQSRDSILLCRMGNCTFKLNGSCNLLNQVIIAWTIEPIEVRCDSVKWSIFYESFQLEKRISTGVKSQKSRLDPAHIICGWSRKNEFNVLSSPGFEQKAWLSQHFNVHSVGTEYTLAGTHSVIVLVSVYQSSMDKLQNIWIFIMKLPRVWNKVPVEFW